MGKDVLSVGRLLLASGQLHSVLPIKKFDHETLFQHLAHRTRRLFDSAFVKSNNANSAACTRVDVNNRHNLK